MFSIILLVGGFNPFEKYESLLGILFSIYGKIQNVPNHQEIIYDISTCSIIYIYIYHKSHIGQYSHQSALLSGFEYPLVN